MDEVAALVGGDIEAYMPWRVEPPAATRKRLEDRLDDFGITRVANVTGLDRLGLPVFMAIRPLSRSLAVSQGKGLTRDAAWVSGVMESIELWHAENPGLALRFASMSELGDEHRVLNMPGVPMRKGSPFTPEYRIMWVEGREWTTGDPILVPYGLVHVNSVPPFPPGDDCFHVTSNGLASGMDVSDALAHALCEIVERDAVATWQELAPDANEATWIDLGELEPGFLRGLLEYCDGLDFDVIAAQAPSPVGLPVVVCVLLDRREEPGTLRAAAMGFGCDLRRDLALLRAFTEAAQSRLTLIAGSRDDLDRVDYEQRRRHRHGLETYRRLVGGRHPVSYGDVPDFGATQHDSQVSDLLSLLAAAGCPEVAVVELSRADWQAKVVRAIVPGLRGPDHAH